MKKLLLLLLFIGILFCTAAFGENATNELSCGDSIYLGHYEQDNQLENGTEPIEWVVLELSHGKALLISKYALDCQAYNNEKTEIAWENSSLRQWLNNEFYQNAFILDEQAAVSLTNVSNGDADGNPEWSAFPSAETEDRLFLLSYREASVYFPTAEDRKATGTEYARAHGAKFLGITTIGFGETDWWLRSTGTVKTDAAFIGVVGDIYTKAVSDKIGVRPALWLDLSVDRTFFPYEQYILAAQYEADGRYEEAVTIFENLGAYNDSEACAKRCLYQQANAALTNGGYAEAYRIFESLGDYEESFLLARAARYALAVEYQNAGDYETAAQMFEKVGQYEDSMSRLKTCYEKLGISVYYFDAEAINTGVDTGYSRTDAISGNDNHFGWRLGRFFASGFTRVNAEDTKQPIFIKTLGDSVTLWFDLEQDIEALNGNGDLSIAEDINGYDQYFGVQKTNFGRGTLIVRHTDYQNSKGVPQIYTDYVLAKGTSGADTKVVLNEEGDYEVALNYEIQDNNLMHIAGKYGNYRIFLRFSIRNGNCMVFPFDVLTGAELQNTSVTENGFSLDLARSRYLDINVKRSVIMQGPTGMVEDERFNRPAKDGDQYTAEGIYTISVSNRYTGESTVKTIFVGTNELLQAYIANGFSADRLN